jgi:hypothetical protein
VPPYWGFSIILPDESFTISAPGVVVVVPVVVVVVVVVVEVTVVPVPVSVSDSPQDASSMAEISSKLNSNQPTFFGICPPFKHNYFYRLIDCETKSD